MIFRFIALVATGFLSGAFVYGLLNVVPTFYEVPVSVHLIYRTQLMNHNGITMQTLMGLSIIAPLCYAITCWNTETARNLALLSAGLAVAALLVTRFGNVPINQLIKTWLPANPPADWQQKLRVWDIFNIIRTVAAIGGFVSFLFSAFYSAR